MHEVDLKILDQYRGPDIATSVPEMLQNLDILQFKWGYEVTSLAHTWQDIRDNVVESLQLIRALHKKCWEGCRGFLQEHNIAGVILQKREKELWDVFEPVGAKLAEVEDLVKQQHCHPGTPFLWAVDPHRPEIQEHLRKLQELAYSGPPRTFKYLDKWGDDLRNVRHEIRKSINIAQLLIGDNFEGSSTWGEIESVIVACLDVINTLETMCVTESVGYMKKEVLVDHMVSRREQINEVFGESRVELMYFKGFVKGKVDEGAPFFHLHLLEFRRQRIVDCINGISLL